MNTQNINTSILAAEICDGIHDAIGKSKLNFCIRQTPYSSYITVRKRFQRQFLDETGHLNCEIKLNENAEILNLEKIKSSV